jgi:hypothetical protein
VSLRGYKKKGRPALWMSAFPKKAEPPSKPKRIRPVSKSRQRVSVEYRTRARAFVLAAIARGETCPVVGAIEELRTGRAYGHPISNRLSEVHHRRGRVGRLLLDDRHWMPVSKSGHRWIHKHPNLARERQWLAQPG